MCFRGRGTEAHQALQDLLKRSRTSHVIPYGIATVYAALGDKDQAFAQLEQAYSQRSFFSGFPEGRPGTRQLAFRPAVSETAGPHEAELVAVPRGSLPLPHGRGAVKPEQL